MEKTIKVIDLLNMISKGEEVPKKIRHFGEEFKLAKDNEYYSVYSSRPLISYFGEDYLRAELNDEVEIIEEVEDKEYEDIEKLGDFNITEESFDDKELGLKLGYTGVSNTFNDVYFKINALIRNQKKIIEKLNKEK